MPEHRSYGTFPPFLGFMGNPPQGAVLGLGWWQLSQVPNNLSSHQHGFGTVNGHFLVIREGNTSGSFLRSGMLCDPTGACFLWAGFLTKAPFFPLLTFLN
eukprot:NODE_5450_length_407_cov_457.594972_g4764_i0.p1 GENE.NODE_5450_length_407_cov_457.594972_g4764_i0~~NODE_5450_length_407_cov_457.594972_g4764_i0.p1  ORF type:complete len:100 (-),score=6.62 NODE_5450_length_407_cov_457.594972_g4764_i0:75-374(-)